MDTLKLENTAAVGNPDRICPLCGAKEPEAWYDAPMNETLREYARSYITPVKVFHMSLWDALAEHGNTEGLEC